MSRCQTDFNYKIYNHPIRPPWLISYLNVSSDPCGFFDENLNKICHLWTTTTYLSKDKFVFIRKSRVNLLEMRGGEYPLETFWGSSKNGRIMRSMAAAIKIKCEWFVELMTWQKLLASCWFALLVFIFNTPQKCLKGVDIWIAQICKHFSLIFSQRALKYVM